MIRLTKYALLPSLFMGAAFGVVIFVLMMMGVVK